MRYVNFKLLFLKICIKYVDKYININYYVISIEFHIPNEVLLIFFNRFTLSCKKIFFPHIWLPLR